MRTKALIGVCVAAAVVALAFTVPRGSETTRAAAPALHVVHKAPLTVKGEHFHAREPIRVSAAGKRTRTKANGEGMFVVTIRGATRCDTVRVVARGSAGSYAVVKILPAPACLPARSR